MNISEVFQANAKGVVIREVYLHQFVDEIRAANPIQRRRSISADKVARDDWAAVVAATVETICREKDDPIPAWTEVVSGTPIFIPSVPPDSKAAAYLRRVSPEPFSRRNVFVTDNFLSRA